MTPAVAKPSADSEPPLLWRLAAPSLAASLALLAIAVLAAVVLFVNQREADRVMEDVAAAAAAAADLEKSILELRQRLTRYAATGDESAMSDVTGLQQAGGEYLLQIERLQITTDRGRVLVTELRRSYGGLSEALQQLSADAPEEERRSTADRLVSDLLDQGLLTRVQQQRELTAQALQAAQVRTRDLTTWTGWTLLLLGVAGAGAGALAGFSLARGLRQQLVELSVPIQTAAGSLDAVVGPLHVRAGGDVADLERSLNVLATRVADVVARLQAAERETLRNDQMAALGQLAAGLAHELRNPLTAIRTLVEAARGQGPGGRLDERDLEVLEEEIGRLDTTLQSFLDYARPPKLERRSVDVRDVVRKTVQLVGARAERQAIRLDVALPDEPLAAQADAEQLRQVLLNLLLNAFDAIGTGGSVRIQAARANVVHSLREWTRGSRSESPARDAAPPHVVLNVLDDGPGIPDSMRDTLFDPFVSSKSAGTGLGLTISRRIVENHGGTITAENRPEGGAMFTVRLPAA
jgi:signal transduction histidine kinase